MSTEEEAAAMQQHVRQSGNEVIRIIAQLMFAHMSADIGHRVDFATEGGVVTGVGSNGESVIRNGVGDFSFAEQQKKDGE